MNTRGVLLTLSLIAIASVVLMLNSGNQKDSAERKIAYAAEGNNKRYLSYDDWIDGKFEAKSFNPKWVSDQEHAVRKPDGSIVKVDIKSESEAVLLRASAWNLLKGPQDFHFSADLNFVAIEYDRIKGYSHYTTTFSVAIFGVNDSERIDIPEFPVAGIQKFKWDPVGSKLAFVHNFDIFAALNFSESPVHVTRNGQENLQFNGIADWVHEQEIEDDDALLWWSPSGLHLAYAALNQTPVTNFDFALFINKQYPDMISYSYSKPGTPIPITDVLIYNTEIPNGDVVKVNPSTKIMDWVDYYLNSVLWASDSILLLTWKNRFGNESVTDTCELTGGIWLCDHVTAMEEISTTGWLGHYNLADLTATATDQEYLTVLSDDTRYLHLVVINTVNNTKDFRTSGTFEVTDTNTGDRAIHCYDSANDWVYFTSTENPQNLSFGLPRIRHLWRVRGHESNRNRECITCQLNNAYPDRCNWVHPSFGPGGRFLVVNCGGTANGVPISTLHEITEDGTVNILKAVEENYDLIGTLNDYHIRNTEYGTIQLPDVPGEDFYYALHKPPKFDQNKKYAMLVFVYSGPAYQNVEDRYNFDWSMGYIASSDLDIIVLSFDGRGTGFRGDDIMHMVYRRLGEYEPQDQIEAARQISSKFDYIDSNRIAIWGRSYGGYVTARTMSEDSEQIFRCGISVAPVTDWKTYSTLYTERYMGLPNGDNEDGYNRSSAISKLHNYGRHYFALVHGTSDENVHFLHAARLSKALIDADIDFASYFAGDENHRFERYSNGYSHHYKLLTKHLRTCLHV